MATGVTVSKLDLKGRMDCEIGCEEVRRTNHRKRREGNRDIYVKGCKAYEKYSQIIRNQ